MAQVREAHENEVVEILFDQSNHKRGLDEVKFSDILAYFVLTKELEQAK